MNLLQIRTLFVNESGRHDLVVDTTDYVDNGANFYINAGQRLLDRSVKFPKESARAFRKTAAGDYGTTFSSCRSIQEVWLADLTDRWQLKLVSMNELRKLYFNEPLGNIQRTDPEVWTPIWARPGPERVTVAEMEVYLGYADFPVGEKQQLAYNGVIWMPPVDKEFQVEVVGLFYTPELSEDTHISYWSEIHPEALVMGAMAVLEIMYRNRQGFGDWMNAIGTLISGIESDTVEQEIQDVLEMEG